MNWQQYTDSIKFGLNSLTVADGFGYQVASDAALQHWRNQTVGIIGQRGTVYLIGNGASASMASHISADLAKTAHAHTEVFTDISLMTAIANDISYNQVFAEPLRRRMKSGDMLVAISSSGQSPNVINAAQAALDLGGFVVTLTGMKPENKLRAMGMLNFHTATATYGLTESCHATVLHCWVDQIGEAVAGGSAEAIQPLSRKLKLVREVRL